VGGWWGGRGGGGQRVVLVAQGLRCWQLRRLPPQLQETDPHAAWQGPPAPLACTLSVVCMCASFSNRSSSCLRLAPPPARCSKGTSVLSVLTCSSGAGVGTRLKSTAAQPCKPEDNPLLWRQALVPSQRTAAPAPSPTFLSLGGAAAAAAAASVSIGAAGRRGRAGAKAVSNVPSVYECKLPELCLLQIASCTHTKKECSLFYYRAQSP
jgi:hypothetical protein